MDPLPGNGSGSGSGSGSAPVPLTCQDFKVIGASRYLLVEQPLNRADAETRCKTVAPGAYLATFETTQEVEDVVGGLPLPMTMKVWTGLAQTRNASGVASAWANQIGTTRTGLPSGFPWRGGEPNDRDGGLFKIENNEENFADLGGDKRFDDADAARTLPPLCECVLPAGEEEEE